MRHATIKLLFFEKRKIMSSAAVSKDASLSTPSPNNEKRIDNIHAARGVSRNCHTIRVPTSPPNVMLRKEETRGCLCFSVSLSFSFSLLHSPLF